MAASSWLDIARHGSSAVRRVALSLVIAVALFAAVGAGSSTVAARSAVDAEKAALAKAVADFNAAMSVTNFGAVLDFMPPKVAALFAKKMGMQPDDFRKGIVAQIQETMKMVKFEAFGMEFGAAAFKESAGGEPFALVPTRTVMIMPSGQKVAANSHTLALLDGGKWYLARVEDATQIDLLREAYPEFAGVELPRGTMEVLKP